MGFALVSCNVGLVIIYVVMKFLLADLGKQSHPNGGDSWLVSEVRLLLLLRVGAEYLQRLLMLVRIWSAKWNRASEDDPRNPAVIRQCWR